jgi:F-type H+-transporting ATPase subunit b
MDATSLATLWATIALIIFAAIVSYLKVPAMIAKSLDERAAKIKNELAEAHRLRQEAQQLLSEYQKRRAEAEKEASDIVAAAKREADGLLEDAQKKSAEYVTRRTALAEQKIGQAEREAVAEVRSIAVDVATEAARTVMASKLDAEAGARLFQDALKAVQAKLQ